MPNWVSRISGTKGHEKFSALVHNMPLDEFEVGSIVESDENRPPTLVVNCRCQARMHRLGNKRAVYCEQCGFMACRVGHRIVATVFKKEG